MIRFFVAVWLIFFSVAASAEVDESYDDPNNFVSHFSLTAQSDFPDVVPFMGGISFGRGQAAFFLDRAAGRTDLDAVNITLSRADNSNYLGLVLAGSEFKLSAHHFAICPMAKHVARGARIGFTLPPYLTSGFRGSFRVVPYRGGYIATEFSQNSTLASLVRSSDFWPEYRGVQRPTMRIDNKLAIMRSISRINMTIPSGATLANGFTYFTGDYHVNASVLLIASEGTVEVAGLPITYLPSNFDRKIQIRNVLFVPFSGNLTLSKSPNENTRFNPADFKSLFDLASVFVAVKSGNPRELSRFIREDC